MPIGRHCRHKVRSEVRNSHTKRVAQEAALSKKYKCRRRSEKAAREEAEIPEKKENDFVVFLFAFYKENRAE